MNEERDRLQAAERTIYALRKALRTREAKLAELQTKYNKLAELANDMGSAYGCSGKPFRDYWEWVEEQGNE